MTNVLAVDASVIAPAIADGGPDGNACRDRIKNHVLAGPDLLRVEVMSVIRRHARSGTLSKRVGTVHSRCHISRQAPHVRDGPTRAQRPIASRLARRNIFSERYWIGLQGQPKRSRNLSEVELPDLAEINPRELRGSAFEVRSVKPPRASRVDDDWQRRRIRRCSTKCRPMIT